MDNILPLNQESDKNPTFPLSQDRTTDSINESRPLDLKKISLLDAFALHYLATQIWVRKYEEIPYLNKIDFKENLFKLGEDFNKYTNHYGDSTLKQFQNIFKAALGFTDYKHPYLFPPRWTNEALCGYYYNVLIEDNKNWLKNPSEKKDFDTKIRETHYRNENWEKLLAEFTTYKYSYSEHQNLSEKINQLQEEYNQLKSSIVDKENENTPLSLELKKANYLMIKQENKIKDSSEKLNQFQEEYANIENIEKEAGYSAPLF